MQKYCALQLSLFLLIPFIFENSSLKLLYLYDACQRIDNYVRELNDVIPQMKSLTHLDISKRCPAEGSRSQNESHFAMHPYLDGKLLEKIATLPDLVYLDISGKCFMKFSLKHVSIL